MDFQMDVFDKYGRALAAGERALKVVRVKVLLKVIFSHEGLGAVRTLVRWLANVAQQMSPQAAPI